MRSLRKGLAAAAVLCLFGCAEDRVAPAESERQLRLAEDLRIGDQIDDEKASFGRVSGLARDGRGRIYVADYQDQQIKVFAPDGSFRFAIGRRGGGPGELSNPCCIAFDSAGLLWVRDGQNRRYSAFAVSDTGATYVSQIRFAHGDVNRFAPTTFDSANQLIDVGAGGSTPGQPETHRFTLGPDGRTLRDILVRSAPAESLAMKTVHRTTADVSMTLYFHQPFGPLQLVAHGPRGEWAHAVSSRFSIDWRAADGSLLRHLSEDIAQGPELSATERQRADEGMQNDKKRAGADLGFSVPSHKPPLRNLYFDRSGRLWVELTVPDGAERRAFVYSPTGVRALSVTWPGDVDLREGAAVADTAWGVAADSLGVQTIVRLRPR
jgi:hypothetical protein